MARDGTGVFNLPAGNPVVTGTAISSSLYNATLNDIAAALSQSLSKDGQTVPTANLPMGGFKLTGLANGSAADDAAAFGQIATAVNAAVSTKAPLDSPALTGNPTAPKATFGDNDTTIATTSFVQDAVFAVTSDKSFTTNGHQTFSNGLIIQWGATPSLGANAGGTVTYSTPFPNACFAVSPIGGAASAGVGPLGLNFGATPKTSFTVWAGANGALAGTYIAIGN